MKKKILFAGAIVIIAAFLLYSLNYGWPGMDVGWASRGAPKPRWFPSAFGGFVSIVMAGLCFYLMDRWRTRP